MKTIKLPYYVSDEEREIISKLLSQSSNMIRLSFNRFNDDLTEKDIRDLSKSYNNIPEDSWLVQCAIKKAKALYEAYKSQKDSNSLIFGGKKNFILRYKNKITKQQLKEYRTLPICSQGEKLQKGNRKFSLDIENNQIVFKISKKLHVNLKLPSLRKNYLRELTLIEELTKNKQLTLSIELTSKYVYITFDDMLINEIQYEGNKNTIASIDMNPNYIGFSICELILH